MGDDDEKTLTLTVPYPVDRISNAAPLPPVLPEVSLNSMVETNTELRRVSWSEPPDAQWAADLKKRRRHSRWVLWLALTSGVLVVGMGGYGVFSAGQSDGPTVATDSSLEWVPRVVFAREREVLPPQLPSTTASQAADAGEVLEPKAESTGVVYTKPARAISPRKPPPPPQPTPSAVAAAPTAAVVTLPSPPILGGVSVVRK